MYTPNVQTINPKISIKYKSSPSTKYAITPVVGGIKKNKFDVLLAVPVLIKYIKIAYAPKDTIIICHPIDKMNLLSKFINETSNVKETIIKKSVAAIA